MNIINSYTLKTLKKNKTRTLVTIIGIILSAAMLTAVTTFISSLQSFLVDTVIDTEGDWHVAEIATDEKGLSYIKGSSEVESSVYAKSVGYAVIDEITNDYKPYLYVAGMSAGFADKMPVKLISGRLPENSGELILPKHLSTNGGVNFSLGDTLSLEMGDRFFNNQTLNQYSAFIMDEDDTPAETFKPHSKAEYTVVGFYERSNFEENYAAGYTALTVESGEASGSYDIYFKLKNIRGYASFINDFTRDGNVRATEDVNIDLMRMYGSSADSSYNAVLYGLAAVLIVIIMFASVSLIYNAFSISVSERTKQFGIISSVGATKRQLFKSVLFEAVILSLVGIPLGILAGIAGIGVTLGATRELFSLTFSAMSTDAVLSLKVTVISVVAAAVVGLVTVLISAFIPARRAVRVSAIDAIRQTSDFSIKASKVKTSKLTYRLFGFEGMIASKNFKRNRKKYRTTVISLFMSIVLFMSASSLVAYLKRGVEDIVDDYDCDIYYQCDSDNTRAENAELYNELNKATSVTASSYLYSLECMGTVEKELINKALLSYSEDKDTWMFCTENENIVNQNLDILFIDDESYAEFLTEKGLDTEKYMNTSKPVALASDSIKAYNSQDGKYRTFNAFSKDKLTMQLKMVKGMEGYDYAYFNETENGLEYVFMDKSNWDESKALLLSQSEACTSVTVDIGGITDEAFAVGTGLGIRLMYPQSAMDAVLGERPDTEMDTVMLYNTSDHSKTYDEMYSTLSKGGYSTGMLMNLAEQSTVNRAMIAIANVFAYGFISLISLIAVANVFNTITTNINLRRREFAMLRSVGMTNKGFRRMMNYECLLYGIKSLLYGLPVSFLMTFVIYSVINNGVVSTFFIPWYSVALAVVSVFAVVFVTMLYAMRKLKKEDTVDALKNENL